VVVTAPTKNEQLPVLQTNYACTPLLVENTGHVIEVPQPNHDGWTLVIGTAACHLQQWHLHAPAEHVVNGHRSDLEIHLVHSDDMGRTAVLAGLRRHRRGTAWQGQRSGREICSAPSCGRTPDTAGEEAPLHETTSAAALLGTGPALFGHNKVTIDNYLAYTGSLTTPPCTGDVGWCLLPKTVITVDPKDVDQLHQADLGLPRVRELPQQQPPGPTAGRPDRDRPRLTKPSLTPAILPAPVTG